MGFRGGAMRKKMASEGGHPKKIRKRESHVKYFSKTSKWHDV